jgi:hypothetical protein
MNDQELYNALVLTLNENDLDPENLRRVMLKIADAVNGQVTKMQLIMACLLLARETDPENFENNILMLKMYKRVDGGDDD